jgi:integrase
VLRLEIGAVIVPPRARMPLRIPVVLTASEVRAVIGMLRDVPRLVVMLLYGAGLRLQECLGLRVKDLDFDRREITVRRGRDKRIAG